jgi:hypothetical protein
MEKLRLYVRYPFKRCAEKDVSGDCRGFRYRVSLLVFKHYNIHKFETGNEGFETAPKCPTPVNLAFILQWANLSGGDIFPAQQMVMNSLRRMALGGIRGKIYLTIRYLII